MSLYEQVVAIDRTEGWSPNDNFLCGAESDSDASRYLGTYVSYSWQNFENYYLLVKSVITDFSAYRHPDDDAAYDGTYSGSFNVYSEVYGGGLPTGADPIVLNCVDGVLLETQTIYPGAEEKLLWTVSDWYGEYDHETVDELGFFYSNFLQSNHIAIYTDTTPIKNTKGEWVSPDIWLDASFYVPIQRYGKICEAIINIFPKEVNQGQSIDIEYLIGKTDFNKDKTIDYALVNGFRDDNASFGRNTFSVPSLIEQGVNLEEYFVNTTSRDVINSVVVYYTDGTSSLDSIPDDMFEAVVYYTTEDSPTTIKLVDCLPILNYEVVDTNPISLSYTGDEHTLVKHISNAQVSVSHEACLDGTIIEHWFVHNGLTYKNYEVFTFDEKIVSNAFTIYAKDNRKQVNSELYEAPFIPYVPLSCNFRSSRPNGDGEVNIEVYGNCWLGNFGAIENELFVYYRYKKQTETEFSDWVLVPNAVYDSATDTYKAEALVKNLDYTSVYVFQAQVADVYTTVNSLEKLVGTKPIFDWSATDFNFNIPVNINGTLYINGEPAFREAENTILWSGNNLMTADQTIYLSKLISEQPNGIVLVFSGAESDTSWSTHFVPKIMPQINNGGGQTFFIPLNAEVAELGFKYLYIYDNRIEGQSSNANSGGAASNLWFNNAIFALRYVIGV